MNSFKTFHSFLKYLKMFILKKCKYDTKVVKHKWKMNNVKGYIFLKNQQSL